MFVNKNKFNFSLWIWNLIWFGMHNHMLRCDHHTIWSRDVCSCFWHIYALNFRFGMKIAQKTSNSNDNNDNDSGKLSQNRPKCVYGLCNDVKTSFLLSQWFYWRYKAGVYVLEWVRLHMPFAHWSQRRSLFKYVTTLRNEFFFRNSERKTQTYTKFHCEF